MAAHRYRFCASLGVVVVLGAGGGTVALAQSGGDQLAADRQAGIAMEEVIVTARKREEALSDVPLSIAVLGGDEIAKHAIPNFEELDEQVPNFFVARSPGADSIFMRGLGSGSGSPTLEQSVVLFVDEIYAGNARQFQTPWLDVNRVEVLRGPQGYLVGKNTSAGAVRFVSNRPGPVFEGRAAVEYDFERDGPTFTGILSGPINDAIGLRGAVSYRDLDGYITNVLNGEEEPGDEQLAGRLVGTYESDRFDALVKLEATTLDKDGNPYVMTSQIAGRPLDRTKESGSSLGPDYDDHETQNAVVQLNFNLGDYTLSSITGYSAYDSKHGTDADFFEADLAYTIFEEDFDQISQEFRLLSPDDQTLEYVVGLYWHTSDLDEMRATAAVFAPPSSTYRTYVQSNDSWSTYASLTWNVTDAWSLQGGLRYTHEKKDAHYVRLMGPDALDGIGAVDAEIRDSLSDGEIDPGISLQWRPNQALMFYVSYAEGYKAGGFQGAIPNATATAFEIRPETAEAIELGVKGSYDRGSFEIAIFDTTYDDLQVSASVPTDPNTTVFAFFTGNAAEATSRGVELSGTFQVTENFRIRGALAWLDGEYDSYEAGPCAQGQPVQDPVRGSCSLTGVDLPFAPDYSGFVSLLYERPITSRWTIAGDVTTSFRDDFRTDAPNDPRFVQESYEKVDVRLAMTRDEKLEVALLVRNLTDEYTFGFGGSGTLAAHPVLGFAPDARMFPLDPPRSFLVQVQYQF
jgi:iron complex outermembrane receptor protein